MTSEASTEELMSSGATLYTREEILAAAKKIEEWCLPASNIVDVLDGKWTDEC